ncbi:hypothetical protein PR048_026182 [Dryococelus australis]|uniref:Uncharacterized protein n=1 Tax=Dryococelus australis TaxID=614101 RepID=A0ABQ9GKM5_9NEOP|nr:hypothetical protein PR048_026182 [Dryococelus australis]
MNSRQYFSALSVPSGIAATVPLRAARTSSPTRSHAGFASVQRRVLRRRGERSTPSSFASGLPPRGRPCLEIFFPNSLQSSFLLLPSSVVIRTPGLLPRRTDYACRLFTIKDRARWIKGYGTGKLSGPQLRPLTSDRRSEPADLCGPLPTDTSIHCCPDHLTSRSRPTFIEILCFHWLYRAYYNYKKTPVFPNIFINFPRKKVGLEEANRTTAYPAEVTWLVTEDLEHVASCCLRDRFIDSCSNMYRTPAVRLLASHQGDPGLTSGRFTPDFRRWESCRTMPLDGGLSRDLPFTLPFHSVAALYSTHSTLIGSQGLDVKSHPNLFTHLTTTDGIYWLLNITTRAPSNGVFTALAHRVNQALRILPCASGLAPTSRGAGGRCLDWPLLLDRGINNSRGVRPYNQSPATFTTRCQRREKGRGGAEYHLLSTGYIHLAGGHRTTDLTLLSALVQANPAPFDIADANYYRLSSPRRIPLPAQITGGPVFGVSEYTLHGAIHHDQLVETISILQVLSFPPSFSILIPPRLTLTHSIALSYPTDSRVSYQRRIEPSRKHEISMYGMEQEVVLQGPGGDGGDQDENSYVPKVMNSDRFATRGKVTRASKVLTLPRTAYTFEYPMCFRDDPCSCSNPGEPPNILQFPHGLRERERGVECLSTERIPSDVQTRGNCDHAVGLVKCTAQPDGRLRCQFTHWAVCTDSPRNEAPLPLPLVEIPSINSLRTTPRRQIEQERTSLQRMSTTAIDQTYNVTEDARSSSPNLSTPSSGKTGYGTGKLSHPQLRALTPDRRSGPADLCGPSPTDTLAHCCSDHHTSRSRPTFVEILCFHWFCPKFSAISCSPMRFPPLRHCPRYLQHLLQMTRLQALSTVTSLVRIIHCSPESDREAFWKSLNDCSGHIVSPMFIRTQDPAPLGGCPDGMCQYLSTCVACGIEPHLLGFKLVTSLKQVGRVVKLPCGLVAEIKSLSISLMSPYRCSYRMFTGMSVKSFLVDFLTSAGEGNDRRCRSPACLLFVAAHPRLVYVTYN